MVWIDFDTNQKLQKNHPNLTQVDNRGEFQRNTRMNNIQANLYETLSKHHRSKCLNCANFGYTRERKVPNNNKLMNENTSHSFFISKKIVFFSSPQLIVW